MTVLGHRCSYCLFLLLINHVLAILISVFFSICRRCLLFCLGMRIESRCHLGWILLMLVRLCVRGRCGVSCLCCSIVWLCGLVNQLLSIIVPKILKNLSKTLHFNDQIRLTSVFHIRYSIFYRSYHNWP